MPYNCSEETAWIRPKKNYSKKKQKAEEICLGQETQGIDSRAVEICDLVWWVQIWDLWFHPVCLCATQRRWTDGFYMHGSHTEPAWLPQHPAATCHPIRFAFSWTIIYFSTGQGPNDGVLHQMTWPPQSPDINPMEMVWDDMDHRVKTKEPTSS